MGECSPRVCFNGFALGGSEQSERASREPRLPTLLPRSAAFVKPHTRLRSQRHSGARPTSPCPLMLNGVPHEATPLTNSHSLQYNGKDSDYSLDLQRTVSATVTVTAADEDQRNRSDSAPILCGDNLCPEESSCRKESTSTCSKKVSQLKAVSLAGRAPLKRDVGFVSLNLHLHSSTLAI